MGLLPGLEWANRFLSNSPVLLRWTTAAALSYTFANLTTLLLHYLPGPVYTWQILVVFNILAIIPIINKGKDIERTPTPQRPNAPTHYPLIPLFLILIVALFLQTTNLHYSEFQGDEALAMITAAEALEGHEDALFLRSKGPGEVLLPMTLWRLSSTITETIARLPFTIASILAIITIYLIGQEFAGEQAGWLAAGFFALNGFMVAFGRIVQYQALVIWLSALAFLMVIQWHKTRQYRFALLGGFCLGTGLLAHYDAILALPAIGWLFVPSSFATLLVHKLTRKTSKSASTNPLTVDWFDVTNCIKAGSLFLLALILTASSFYLPYSLDPQANRTGSYVGGRIGNELRNNLPNFFHFNTFYSSFYYIIITGLLVLGLLTWLLWQAKANNQYVRWSQGLASGLIVIGILAVVFKPTLLSNFEHLPNLAILPFALILLGAFVALSLIDPQHRIWQSPPPSHPLKLHPPPNKPSSQFHYTQTKIWQALIAWLAIPFLGYNFVVALGLTHIYTIVPAWSLLAALGWHYLLDTSPFIQPSRPPTSPSPLQSKIQNLKSKIFLLFLSAVFLWNAFVRHDIEYWQDYPAGNLSFYWTPYQELPQAGFFGFAHRTGWKAIGQQIATSVLTGDYNSNEEPDVTTWYTRGAPRACDPQSEFYFLADDLIDPVSIPNDLIESSYAQIGHVTLSNQKQMRIIQQVPTTMALNKLDEATLAYNFDQTASPTAFARSARGSQPAQANFNNLVQLIGYDLDTQRSYPGGRLPVTLYWQALAPLPTSYQVFTHLESESGLIAQSDGIPVCWTYPTDTWRPGQIIADQHAISLSPDIQPGHYPLEIGLYLPNTLERLDVLDAAGNPAGTSVTLTTVEIKQLED